MIDNHFDPIKASVGNVTEKSIEDRTCSYAVSQGLMPIKVEFPGRKGKSDRLFLGWVNESLVIFFIEFKRPVKYKIAVSQVRFQKLMSHFRIPVVFVKSVYEGKKVIDNQLRNAQA